MEDNDIEMYFRFRLQQLMKRKSISQEWLSKHIGASERTINNYLSGRSIPSFTTVVKIANVMNCSVDDFCYKE